MVNSNNWKSDSTPFTWYPISEHLDLLEHRDTTSAGKPMSILRVEAEKTSPFVPTW